MKLNAFRDEDGTNADLLAEAVLEEVPDQLVGFMTETNEKPGDRNKSKNQSMMQSKILGDQT